MTNMPKDKLKMSAIMGMRSKFDSPYSSDPHICFENAGYNQSLSDLDQREIDVIELAKVIRKFELETEMTTYQELAQHIADNMKMWIRRK